MCGIEVLAIASILAAIALGASLNQVRKAQKTQAYADISAMKPEIIGYRQRYGRFPSDELPNTRPEGVPSFKLKAESGIIYDYNSHCIQTVDNNGKSITVRLVRINGFGMNDKREHDHKDLDLGDKDLGDDVVVTIALVYPEDNEEGCPP